MYISQLKVYNFNNYQSSEVVWNAGINVIVGDNGMGKTNLVDAIYFLCLTKSYFSSLDKYSIREGAEGFRLEGRFELDAYPVIVAIKVQDGKSKDVRISEKKLVKLSDFIGQFPCVIIAPDDVHTLMAGSAERRSFLNNIIVQTDTQYLDTLLHYTKALKQRNALLKQFQEKHYFDGVLLESVSSRMYDAAAYIHTKRTEVVEQIRPKLQEHYAELSEGKEACDLVYRSHLHEEGLKWLLDKHLERDRALGRTSVGIHKDDLVFSLKGKALKNFASQGQLKSYVIALKMAQYTFIGNRNDKYPILILDDMYDKLDASRVEALLKLVSGCGGQVFITDTGRQRIQSLLKKLNLSYKQVIVEKGKIIETNV